VPRNIGIDIVQIMFSSAANAYRIHVGPNSGQFYV
jgi:hypothetical protein